MPIQRTHVGIPPDLFAASLGRALQGLAGVDLATASPAELAHRLRSRALDAALLSPLDLAREASLVSVIPGPCVSSNGATGTVTLHFREGLHDIRSMAADPARQAEIVLARIILSEEFGLQPAIVPMSDNPEAMLGRADAALLVGDASLRFAARHELSVDLVDLWEDLTALPYVHGILCFRQDALPEEVVRMLTGVIPPAEPPPVSTPEAEAGTFSYSYGQEQEDALAEFFRYSFYHGILPDVPDITVC